jgi:antitoxin component of MazEF toxin-antitoxin module
MELEIQKWGNSAAIRLNQSLLRQIKVGIGGSLVAEVRNGGLFLKPVTEPRYSLEDLLSTCTRAKMRLEEEDREWLDDASVGKEV